MSKRKDNAAKPKKMTVKTFLEHFIQITKNENLGRRFCFILGAGASKQSGIPTGAEMVKDWLKELLEMYDDREFKQWAEEIGIKDPEADEAAKYYSQIYDKRFEIDPKEGYGYLEDKMEGKEPSFGYSVLAQIIANTDHNVVITTNFDSLVEDALFIYTQKRPLVCGHESLATFAQPLMRRPLIIKIHRDILLAPKSDSKETSNLADGWKKSLTSLFKFYKPIVIGYGGNDGSLMGFLNSLDAIDGGMFWCYREVDGNPVEEIQKLVMKHKGYIIPIMGFDELMVQLHNKLDLPFLREDIKKIADTRSKNYREQFEEIQKKLSKTPEAFEELEALKSTIKKQKRDWWVIQLMAEGEEDPDKKEQIYIHGLEENPNSAELTGNYANFLSKVRKDYNKAEDLYIKTLELDPQNALFTGNYAIFLYKVRKNYEKAEDLFKKALELDPKNANHIGNYALFIKNIRKDYDRAETLFNKALEIAPDNAIHIGNYANFLKDIKKEYDKVEALYKKSLELDPKNVSHADNYANFLYYIRKDYDKAEMLYKKALFLDPNNANCTANYALFLYKIREDYDKAEELFKKALVLNTENANHIGNYAAFLYKVRKKYDKAEELFKMALALDPEDANHTGNYALFLWKIRKKYDKAENLYKKILELDPKNANNACNYAYFLHKIRKEYNKAEELYKKALELDPENANNIGNYAQMLLENGKKKEGKKYLEKAFSLNPTREDLLVELWFYRYAHFAHWYDRAYKELIKLLKKGARSLHWDLKPNIEGAKKDGHPNVDRLEKLAAIITKNAPMDTLEK
jgi:tetratricopeptide (TPR) repeat protein